MERWDRRWRRRGGAAAWLCSSGPQGRSLCASALLRLLSGLLGEGANLSPEWQGPGWVAATGVGGRDRGGWLRREWVGAGTVPAVPPALPAFTLLLCPRCFSNRLTPRKPRPLRAAVKGDSVVATTICCWWGDHLSHPTQGWPPTDQTLFLEMV